MKILNAKGSSGKKMGKNLRTKIKVGVVLRGDMVKDDSGSYAVFTERESSASQVTAA